jgi:hypothetical protein
LQQTGQPEYNLEYQDGSLVKHYRATDKLMTLDQVLSAFLKYMRGDPSWRTDFGWEKMEFDFTVTKRTQKRHWSALWATIPFLHVVKVWGRRVYLVLAPILSLSGIYVHAYRSQAVGSILILAASGSLFAELFRGVIACWHGETTVPWA